MAIINSFPLPGAFGSVPAYYMIGGFVFDKFNQQVTVHFVIFKDAAARDTYRTAKAQVASLANQIQQKALAMSMAADQEEWAALDEDNVTLQDQFSAAQIALAGAPALEDTLPVILGPNQIAGVLDSDGNVLLSSLYTYVKTLPRFEGATDA